MPSLWTICRRLAYCGLTALALAQGSESTAQDGLPPAEVADLEFDAPIEGPAEITHGPQPAHCHTHCRREFWVVNTRGAPTCHHLAEGVDEITYWRCLKGEFHRRTREQFVAAIDPTLPTTFYVHGNAIDHNYALRNARRIFDDLARGSFRLVLWSWPSEHELTQGIVANVHEKARRSEVQGLYLAWLVSQLDPQAPLTLTGHSLGARTVSASLQALATGEIAGQTLPILPDQHRPIQAVLVAAAMDGRFLWPESRYGSALSQVDQMLITVSADDRSLRRLAWIAPAGGVPLGAQGVPQPVRLGVWGVKVTQVDVGDAIGTAHRWRAFTKTPETANLLRDWFFYWPVDWQPE